MGRDAERPGAAARVRQAWRVGSFLSLVEVVGLLVAQSTRAHIDDLSYLFVDLVVAVQVLVLLLLCGSAVAAARRAEMTRGEAIRHVVQALLLGLVTVLGVGFAEILLTFGQGGHH